MTNRRERRAQRRPGTRRTTQPRNRTRYQFLVMIAVIGLLLLAVASSGLVANAPAPS